MYAAGQKGEQLQPTHDAQGIRPRTPTVAAAREGIGLRRLLRDAAVALSSLAVCAFVVAYALAAPTAGLEASLGPAVPQPGTTAAVLGRIVDSDGSALSGATVEVRRGGRRAGAAVSNDDGSFRVALRGSCGGYSIVLRAHVHGTNVETRSRHVLCPGDALPVDARIVTHGHFLWVPGPR